MAIIKEDTPTTLGVQFVVELQVANHIDGNYLDHEMMASAIHGAIRWMLDRRGYAGCKTTVDSVQYETDYPIDKAAE
jgi:hypothetical protein